MPSQASASSSSSGPLEGACPMGVLPWDASHATITVDSTIGRPAIARARRSADMTCGHAEACASSDVSEAATPVRRIATDARTQAKASRNCAEHAAKSRAAASNACIMRRPAGLVDIEETSRVTSWTVSIAVLDCVIASVTATASAHSSAVEQAVAEGPDGAPM